VLRKKRVRSDRSKSDRPWGDRHSGHSQDSEFFSTCARSRAANLDSKAEDRVIKGGLETFKKASACIIERSIDQLYEQATRSGSIP
jgi:hypothetical protein